MSGQDWSEGEITVRDAFTPGGKWPCTRGDHISAGGGGFYYEDGTYYWVGEKRAEGASLGINLYTSRDLYNWKYESVILSPRDEEGHLLESGCIMERPKLLYNAETRKYVLWFHLEQKGMGYEAAQVGVAQCERIGGPYEFIRGFRPNGHDSRDMTVYQNRDGCAYLIYASEVNLVLRVAELTNDYLGVTKRDEELFRRHREAPAIFEHGGRLYLITSGCTGWDPNRSELHVAESIWGPWEHLGDPARGEGAETTFGSQPTYILPVQGRENAFIYVGNRWRPGQLQTSEHIWLPIQLSDDSHPFFQWHDQWNLNSI